MRIRLWRPISSSCARQRAEPAVRKTALPSASLGRTSSFIGYERASELAWFGTKTGPGQHRGIRPLSTCRAKGKESESAAKCAANEFGNSSPFALRFLSLVAQQSEHPPLKRRVGGANPPEAASFSPRSPTAETTVSEAVQCRCNSCRGHHFRLRSSVERVADYESAGRRCKSCRRHHFNAPVAQCTERRASNAEVGGESPSGSAISNKERQPDQRAGTRC